ncbi:recombination directionality factor [Methylomonas fluvii]|uniref:recombination directionality factor n=1 Tax=Methylomonas fluvii TaxID=1854564 RepID=UPI001CE0FFFF|nr:hydrolase or metal-binding protein [Methylomonas fluvii]
MLKGLAITPPILGRIAIGKVVEKDGKRLPVKDDQFTITSQLQQRDGWILHPVDEVLRKAQGGKIRSIPIRLLFNEPDLNFRAEYSLFDRANGRPLCVGDGERCKRRGRDGLDSLPCPAPEACPLAANGACKPYGRLNVLIGDDDPLGSFIFRTTGFNSIRTLAARLEYFKAVSGNRLSCLPLELKLRGKSTRQSHGSAIFYVDITLRGHQSIEEALSEAKRLDDERQAAGFDQAALDQAARVGFRNGAFEDNEDDGSAVVEEFFPGVDTDGRVSETSTQSASAAHGRNAATGAAETETATEAVKVNAGAKAADVIRPEMTTDALNAKLAAKAQQLSAV